MAWTFITRCFTHPKESCKKFAQKMSGGAKIAFGFGKLLGMTFSGVFTLQKNSEFANDSFKRPHIFGMKSIPFISTAVTFGVAVFSTNTVTRFFPAIRKKENQEEQKDQQDTFENDARTEENSYTERFLTAPPIAHQNSFKGYQKINLSEDKLNILDAHKPKPPSRFHPNVSTKKINIFLYRAINGVIAPFYSLGGGLATLLGVNAVASYIIDNDKDTCKQDKIDVATCILWGAWGYLMASTMWSFFTYNDPNIRQYTIKLLMERRLFDKEKGRLFIDDCDELYDENGNLLPLYAQDSRLFQKDSERYDQDHNPYELCVLQGNMQRLQKGKLYIAKDEYLIEDKESKEIKYIKIACIKYKVITPDKSYAEGQIKSNELKRAESIFFFNQFLEGDTIDLSQLQLILSDLLRITAKRGHTYQKQNYDYEGRLFTDGMKFDQDYQSFSHDKEIIMKSGWRYINGSNYLNTILTSALGSFFIDYTNPFLITLIIKQSCHIIQFNSEPSLDKKYVKTIAFLNASANFIVTMMMSLGASYDKQEKERKNKKEDKKNTTSEFGCLEIPLMITILLNDLIVGASTFIACVHIPKCVADKPEYNTNIITLVLSAIAFCFAVRNQYILDHAAFDQEEGYRRKKRETRETASILQSITLDGKPEEEQLQLRSNKKLAAISLENLSSTPSQHEQKSPRAYMELSDEDPHSIAKNNSTFFYRNEKNKSRIDEQHPRSRKCCSVM
ncbi:MAG: hypothetical protein ACD_60C00038G0032 [uncultured bacterium]|nr:MAG: hypothetical protein ACD_60C00038G0032 [uncultured bacterium]